MAKNLKENIWPAPWRNTLSALCALLVGIGLARFSYTPLLPALVAAHWFTASEAAYLGAANFGGYFVGALLARIVAKYIAARIALRAGMLLATISLFACIEPWAFSWYFVWRFLAGFSGGIIMVLAAPTVLPFIPRNRLGLAGGIIFTGVGLGIALSGTVVPATLSIGLEETWLTLGALAFLLTLISWNGWPISKKRGTRKSKPAPSGNLVLYSLYLEYGLNAFALVPHMVFWAVFIAQGLKQGITIGSFFWVLFGIGAVIGPSTMGYISDRIGVVSALRLGYVIQIIFIGGIYFFDNTIVLFFSSLLIGAFVPGSTTLVLGRLRELITNNVDIQTAGWRLATIAFAIGQAMSGYFLSFCFDQTNDYRQLYIIGSGALGIALALNYFVGRRN